MALTGRIHPLLIHFPIALAMVAAAAEGAAALTGSERWRRLGVGNIRGAAGFGLLAAIAGWRLALAPGMEPAPLLEWHRWLGTLGAALCVAAAVAAPGEGRGRLRSDLRLYQMTVFGAALVIGVAGHLGGVLVWGADFLRP
jgi:uncharacterized membrane protein